MFSEPVAYEIQVKEVVMLSQNSIQRLCQLLPENAQSCLKNPCNEGCSEGQVQI